MSYVKLSTRGSFKKSYAYLDKVEKVSKGVVALKEYGERGIKELYDATPKDTGKTAESWYYVVQEFPDGAKLTFSNSNIAYSKERYSKKVKHYTQSKIPVALLIQYGHVTPTGGYVPPIDYINPCLQPLFNDITERVWKEVKDL